MTWLSFTRILTAIAMVPYFLFNYLFNDYAYPAVSKSGAYVFCYFVGNEIDEQRIHLAVSTDGYNFEALNNNEPIIKQTKGTGCVRDPYMLKGVDENGKEINGSEAIPQALPFYNGADKLNGAAIEGIGNKVVMKEGDEEFVRFYGNGTSGEARITVFNTTGNATGQYAVIKYRIPTPADPAAYEDKVFDIFTSTVNTAPTGNDVAYFSKVLTYDEWVIIVVDISKFTKTNSAFSEKNGEYTANFLAFDCFNKATATSSYIDIAYIGMTDDLADVEALAAGVGQYTLIVDNVDANQVVVPVAAAE